ncbi:FGGY family carbohydrate kinase [Oricola thermophila]|uniref:FGGY-family carbohydrate kinase n=1 Tax=Oricola thermophila TaxID=2742145 RepID=A0A6N1VEU1_9HYPH|nr:FGGY-family carbohydrate kinase [Oricola thermophila]QKV19043.1 FGGY-family carbohydrate kinase [Oricola thermophila]
MPRAAVLAIDEGTTNSKAVLVSASGEIVAASSAPVPIRHPRSGWVEQDASEIWMATRAAIAGCLKSVPEVEIVALGISNQRESILIWDRATGAPLGPVVTWQCRRTSAVCDALRQAGHEPDVIARTGLPLDPLFPATKAAWLLGNCAGAGGDICIGTVDSWLIWKLTGCVVHETDRSNAARTQLFNLAEGHWDQDLCDLFGVPVEMLPQVRDSAHVFGKTAGVGGLPDGIPVASAIGDSHAALFGHGAFGAGDGKITFGTGSSIMTTMPEFTLPPAGITTTIAWSLGGRSTFAFEGNILVSASILPWAAEMLGLGNVDALLDLAQSVEDAQGVSLVPAHVGLGSPHWNADARGLVCGLSFNSGPGHLARAAAESMAFQVNDILSLVASAAKGVGRVFVDGGPSRNRFLMQLVADYIDRPVAPSRNSEASAMGAAYLAGLAVGFWSDIDVISGLVDHGAEILPSISREKREDGLAAWARAIARTTLEV